MIRLSLEMFKHKYSVVLDIMISELWAVDKELYMYSALCYAVYNWIIINVKLLLLNTFNTVKIKFILTLFTINIHWFVTQILVVIEPLLIDEDYYARVEGREIISNLAKAAGLATMISTMRPDIDNIDEYVRNTTARAFAVVASALGIPSLLPFLKAVCRSKKSWQARHTGQIWCTTAW